MECRICGEGVPQRSAGRPAEYCSVACRRVAEFELRRTNKALARLEDRIRSHEERIGTRLAPLGCCLGHAEEHLEALRRQQRELTERLLTLAADGKEQADA